MILIRCETCGEVVGSVEAPSKESLSKIAQQDAMLASLVVMLPANVTEVVAALCTFNCPAHTIMEVGTNGVENQQAETRGDALDEEVRQRKEKENASETGWQGGKPRIEH